MRYLGDITASSTIRGSFNTRTAAGAPITLGGSPVLSVYKDGGTTEVATGVTLTVDFDSRTGHHVFAIDTSSDGSFYAAGSDFRVVITTGTVDSISVVGTEVACFSIANRSALRPTTAGRTLDVSATGEAGIDLANVGSPTTTLNLSGTTISTSQEVASVSGAVGSVTGNVGGNVAGSVATLGTLPTAPTDWLTAAAVKADAVTKIQTGLATSAALATVDSVVDAIQAKTDNLPSDPADASDIAASFGSIASTLSTIAGYIDTEILAIKAKTDNLPSDPATETTLATLDGLIDSIKAITDLLTLANINAQVDTALTDYDPPTRTEATADKAAILTEVEKIPRAGAGSYTHTRTGGSTGVDEVTITETA